MSFSDNFWELRKKKKKEEENAPKRDSLGNLSFNGAIAALDKDIAPVKTVVKHSDVHQWKKQQPVTEAPTKSTLFEGGAFEDGYQFGDITKSITGTVTDLGENLLAGALSIGETTADALGSVVGGVAGALGNKDLQYNMRLTVEEDLINEEAVAKKIMHGMNIVNPMYYLSGGEKAADNSFLGEKSDSIAQSVGLLLDTVALQGVGVPWWLTSGVTSFGANAESALREDTTYGEAMASSAISTAGELLTEKLFGGSGLGEKGLINLEPLTKGITNKVVKSLADFGINMGSEGFEEVASQVIGNLGSALYKEENLWDILTNEEAIDGYITSFIGGAVLGGIMNAGKVINAVKTGTDYHTGVTADDQKVIDTEIKNRIAEAEADGEKLTSKQKKAIEEQVYRDVEKGYIDTDTIEEVLGGDVYKMYKDSADKDAKTKTELENEIGQLVKTPEAQFTVEQRERLTELRDRLKELENDGTTQSWKETLDTEISQKLQNSRLVESYNEQTRRGETFEADISKYDTKQQAVIQKAIDSGILNNTNRTHDFVDMVAKISADKGVSFDFTDNEKLKTSGFALDGKAVNGYVTKDGVTLNIDSHKSLNSVVGHEITHVLEGTEFYTELQNTLFEYAKTKGEYDSRLNSLTELYKGVKDADVNAELTADLVGDYLFTDSDFVTHLSTTNRNVFQKIYDEVKYLYKVATAGSKEARELERVKRAFDKAYKESGKATSGTKYSVSDSDGKQLTAEQNEYFKNSKMRDDNGNLKVMYHGSQDAGFHVFDSSMSDDDTSFFFVDRNDVATTYSGTSETYAPKAFKTAEDANKFFAEIGQTEYEVVEENGKYTLLDDGDEVATSNSLDEIFEEWRDWSGLGYGDANYKVYLNLENPLEVDAEGRTWKDVTREYSQEVADRYNSLTTEEKAALTDLAEWGELGIFRSELQDAVSRSKKDTTDTLTNTLASAYEKLKHKNISIYDIFSIASENFSEESIKQFAVKEMTTRDYAAKAKTEGYDGVIFKNIVDNGGYSNGSEGASTVAIAFSSEQIKSVGNDKPTADKDIRYSLSKDGETSKRYGNYNVYGKDIKLEKAQAEEDVAPISPTTETNAKPMENGATEFDEFAPITEEEANAMSSGYLDSLTDADAPPEMDAPYYAPREAITIDSEGLKKITDSVNSILYLNAEDSARMADVIQTFAKNENVTREELADFIRNNFEAVEEIEDTQATDELNRAKKFMRGTRLYVPDDIRSEFNGKRKDGYNAFRKEHMGHFFLTSDPTARGIDSLYKELSDSPENGGFGNLFPSKIINPADQLKHMGEVATSTVEPEIHSMPFDDGTIQEAVNAIYKGIAQYSQDDLLQRMSAEQNAISQYYGEKDFAPIAPDMDGLKTTSDEVVKDIAPTPPSAPTMEQTNAGQPEKIAKRLPPKTAKEAKQERRKKNGRLWSLFRNHFIDKQSSVEDLSLKSKNRELMGKANFMLSSDARAQRFIAKGAKGVRALNDIRKEVQDSGLYEKFENYLDHKHNVDRMSIESNAQARIAELQGKFGDLRIDQIWAIATKEITDKTTERTATTIREAKEYLNAMEAHNKPVFGASVTAEHSMAAVAQFEAQHPQFVQWAQEIYSNNKYLRQMMIDNGIITQETADLWEKMYPHYVPTTRAEYNGAAINVPLDTNRTGVNAPVKRATGGNSDMVDTFEAIADRVEQTFRAVAKNNFGVELKNTLEAARNGANKASGIIPNDTATDIDTLFDIVERHEELLKKGENGAPPTFTVFENGERVEFEITEDLYEALRPTSEGLKKTIPVVSHAANLHKKVLTEYNLAFAATNAIKDAQSVIVNSQHPVRTYLSFPEAMGQLIMRKGVWIDEYMANGGEELTYFEGDTKRFADDDSAFKKIVGFPLKGISLVNNFVEKIPRLAEYIASRKAGASVEVAMLDAARVTTNFSAGGDVTKFANKNGATFLNASVQGAAQQVRNIREAKANGLKGVLGLVGRYAAAGLPAVLFNSLMWDDDEEYEELSDYVKDNYYVVAKFGDGEFVRIPKGREVAVIQKATELIENIITGEDEIGFTDIKDLGSLAMSNLAPNNPIKNNIIAPISQAIKNEAWYGGDIVPTRLQDVPAAEQFDESIDSISKWLGEKTNLSPYKINYLLDQYSGIVGDMFLPMLTPEAEGGGDTVGGKITAPIRDKFTTDSVTNNKTISDFYDTKDQLTTNAKSIKATDEDILKYKYINSVNEEISELYKQQREIQNSNMTDSKKYIAVRDIQKQINELAENAIGESASVNIQGKYASVGDIHYRWYEPSKDSKSEAGWQKITEDQLKQQNKVTRGLGITPSDYWGNKEEYDFAYEKPEKYAVSKSVGGYTSYKRYTGEIYDIKGVDLDGDGRSDSGTRKEKVLEYLNNLDIDYYEKLILFKSEYNADDTYNYEIVDYLNGRDDISYEDTVIILKELGFDVDSKGNVTWD